MRLRFVLIGGVLLGVVALVVHRAEQSIETERVARHDAVAERLFDEIEGELSAFLEGEETRDSADYLARGPAATRGFVVASFELRPDGHFVSRPNPDAVLGDHAARLDHLERLTRAALAIPAGKTEPGEALLTQTLGESQDGKERDAREHEEATAQRAGSTQNLKALGRETDASGGKDSGYSAYDALQSLNRSVQQRALRKDRALGRRHSDPGNRPEPSAPHNAGRVERVDDFRGLGSNDGFAAGVLDESATGLLQDRAQMQARALDPAHLLLFRTIVRKGLATRQGLWIDTPRFFGWLEEAVVGASSVASVAALRFYGPFDETDPLPSGEFVYRHRFGEPFDTLRATLALDALPGLGGAVYTRALSILLLLAALLSLFALYRMLGVAFRFAERRSNFVAAVSHELKTPLTAIRMYAEMLRDNVVSDESQRRGYYASITDESERLSRLIDNVLEFSKLEKGRHELALVAGSVEPVLHEVERLLAAHVQSAGFELAVEIEPGLPTVRYDRDALLQVLFNLVDNALKYAGDGTTRRVTLCCERAGGGVSISVRDFGPGLAAGELGKIFEPFYRGGDELTRRARGSGIGLSLVRSLGEAMGASVRAENMKPAGLRVSLTLETA